MTDTDPDFLTLDEQRACVDVWLRFDADHVVRRAVGIDLADGATLGEVVTVSESSVVARMAKVPEVGDVVACPFMVGIEVYDGRLVRVGECAYLLVGWDASVRFGREQALAHRASHDPLTELPNRNVFRDRCEVALATRPDEVGVALIGLRDMQSVSDLAGHGTGDEVLHRIANRLVAAAPAGAMVARMSGDEFAVLLTASASIQEASAQVAKLLERIAEPVDVDGFRFAIRAGAGVVRAGEEIRDCTALLRYADLALVEARGRDRGVVAFDPATYKSMMRRLSLRADLADAIPAGSISGVYQPVVALADRTLAGVEALARWSTDAEGAIDPEEFVALAEDADLIHGIGGQMLERACQQLVAWGDAGPRWVSVNVSPRQLADGNRLVAQVERALEASGLEGSRLTLELTERLFVSDPAHAAALLHRVHDLGVRVALDDFGTGYSSLSSVAHYPIDVIKLDKSFVDGVVTDQVQRRMIEAITALADALGAKLVAEGIESADQARILGELGCHYGQGFWFGRPMQADDLLAWQVPGC